MLSFTSGDPAAAVLAPAARALDERIWGKISRLDRGLTCCPQGPSSDPGDGGQGGNFRTAQRTSGVPLRVHGCSLPRPSFWERTGYLRVDPQPIDEAI